jgi:hypothetical protein
MTDFQHFRFFPLTREGLAFQPEEERIVVLFFFLPIPNQIYCAFSNAVCSSIVALDFFSSLAATGAL